MGAYKAIISDIDGTLTPLNPYVLPSEIVTRTINQAIEKGMIFSLASGRPLFLVENITRLFNGIGPCIVDNGALIVDSQTGKTLWEANLPPKQANRIIQIAKDCKLVRASCDSGGIDNPKIIPKNTKIRKMSVHDIYPNSADTIIANVTNEFNDVAAVKAASYEGDHLVDVYFSNILATKQHAVITLAKLLNISPTEIIGIGDGYNDFSLLMACGLKVAMANAVNELKAIADEIAPSVDEDGLAYIIKKYFL
jgi:hypothetical protein